MTRFPLKDKHVIVTGASEGIGREFALEAAKRGARVSLAARSSDRLEELAQAISLAGGTAAIFPTDVADESACAKLVADAVKALGEVDVLVANAGLGSGTQGDGLVDLAVIHRLMTVNFFGAVATAAAAIPSLQKTRGLVVAVSSLQGLLSLPKSSAYAASKHAMQGYFASLRLDLAPYGVGVLIVSPGAVATNIHREQITRYKGMTMAKIQKRSMSARACAMLMCDAIEARKRDLVMTRGGRFAVRVRPFFPDFIDRLVTRSVRNLYR
jgi:short-subunit dehydrogenase